MHGDLGAHGQDLTAAYRLGPVLGQGAFGAVHRARDLASGRDVALKLLGAERQGAAAAVERFLREAAVVAGLEHPGIVRVHAAGLFGGRLAIVYELVEGETFTGAVRTRAAAGRAALVRDAARAVGHAHARGVVHRDLKPDNLLVDRDGRLRVADFGLAWHEGADRLTRTGAVLGTPHYMAPELFERGAAAGPASDVWALGVTLYEALTGRLPFDGPDLVHLMARVQHARIVPPREVDPAIDPALEAVCLRALARDPARRPPDGEALARALDDALAGRQAGARRRAWPLAVAAGGAVVLAVVALVMTPAPPAADAASATPPGPAWPDARATAPASAAALRDRQLVAARTRRWALWVDDRRVVTGGADDDARLLDAATGEELRAWRCPAAAAARLAPGRLALATEDGLRVLDVDAPGPPAPLGRLQGVTHVVAARSTGLVAAIGRGPGGARPRAFVVAPGGEAVAVSINAGFPPVAVALSDDGALLAVATRDLATPEPPPGTPGWQIPPGGPLYRFDVAGEAVTLRDTLALPGVVVAMSFSAGGDLMLAGTTAGQVGLVPRVPSEMEDHLRPAGVDDYAHEGAVRALALSPDARRALTAGDAPGGLELKVWDLERRAVLGTLTAPGQAVSLDLAPDGRAVAIGTTHGGVHVRVVGDDAR